MPTTVAVRRTAALAFVLGLVLGLAACSSGEPSATSSTQTTTVPSASGTGLSVVEDSVETATATALAAATEKGHDEVSAPGAIVAVRTTDGTWVATIGSTALEGTRPMTPDMHQRVGSVTKTFTSTVLLQLAGEGALSLDDPISTYVPGTPNPQATLGQLSAMRSGIPSYTQTNEFSTAFFADPSRSWPPQELVDLVKGDAPMFEPGTAFDYSNTNIVLLGMVIEQVTGRPITEVMDERIIGPLGLSGTVFPTDASFPDPHSQGYTVQGQDGQVPADTAGWNPSWAWTAGAMISTVDDLLGYGRELATGGRLLTPEMQAVRIASYQDMVPGQPTRRYGYGLQLSNGWTGHTGELPGFNTFMYHQADADITVVVMVNSDIKSGACTGGDAANTVPGGRATGPCLDPAVHIADLVTAALGYPGNPGDLGDAGPSTTTAG